MKTKIYTLIVLSAILASCSSLQQTSVNDDLYYSPKDDAVVSNTVQKQGEFTDKEKIQQKEFEKQISAILEDDSKENIDTLIYENEETVNPYEDILVRDRDEAYQKRLDGFSNPYYGFNNYAIYMSDAYWYASAYDPYFYNIIIMGDQIWVEPKYISASFGYWPRHSIYNYGFRNYYSFGYYGYYDPYYYGYSYSPYYSSYYAYYNPYRYYYNNNYVGTSFHSYRQRSLASRYSANSGAVVSSRSRGSLPETYMGRGVSRSSTVKEGLNRQTRTSRSGVVSGSRTRTTSDRVTRTVDARTRSSSRVGTYSRSGNSSRSSYNSSRSSSTRYNRPSSTSRSGVGRSTSTRSGSSYSNSRSNSRSNSGSSYRSSGSSRSSGTRSGSSVRSSGSSRSSGVSRSSGSSRSSGTRSSGSSRSSSGSSSRGSRR